MALGDVHRDPGSIPANHKKHGPSLLPPSAPEIDLQPRSSLVTMAGSLGGILSRRSRPRRRESMEPKSCRHSSFSIGCRQGSFEEHYIFPLPTTLDLAGTTTSNATLTPEFDFVSAVEPRGRSIAEIAFPRRQPTSNQSYIHPAEFPVYGGPVAHSDHPIYGHSPFTDLIRRVRDC
ncbi:hypothetical protein FRB94_011365 [Tulasnella sp. JGI-2019a]|nr:hypothetical protein FRB94_011365 [Tulasnella sp. JGI-2019a]KAG9017443.1 hypothetical protein FRB93_007558 [Tulasnella sp. JGI-2019a]KAG9038530.1 hypothetical protein FRB95_000751 [Tulasnella sp. JGI-2019a]